MSQTLFKQLSNNFRKVAVEVPIEAPPTLALDFQDAFIKAACDLGCDYSETSALLSDLSQAKQAGWVKSKQTHWAEGKSKLPPAKEVKKKILTWGK